MLRPNNKWKFTKQNAQSKNNSSDKGACRFEDQSASLHTSFLFYPSRARNKQSWAGDPINLSIFVILNSRANHILTTEYTQLSNNNKSLISKINYLNQQLVILFFLFSYFAVYVQHYLCQILSPKNLQPVSI